MVACPLQRVWRRRGRCWRHHCHAWLNTSWLYVHCREFGGRAGDAGDTTVMHGQIHHGCMSIANSLEDAQEALETPLSCMAEYIMAVCPLQIVLRMCKRHWKHHCHAWLTISWLYVHCRKPGGGAGGPGITTVTHGWLYHWGHHHSVMCPLKAGQRHTAVVPANK